MADPNRLRVSDPVCEACGKQVKTIALEGGLYRCPACTLRAKGLPVPERSAAPIQNEDQGGGVMGDRVIVVMKDGDSYSPGVYLHWGGSGIIDLLQRAAPRMRAGDASYASARFCGVAHEELDGG